MHEAHFHSAHYKGTPHGPFRTVGLNPTVRRYDKASTGAEAAEEKLPVKRQWRARDNRKGRHSIEVPDDPADHDQHPTSPQFSHPPRSSEVKSILRGLWRMLTVFPVWDVSYLVALTFVLGSIVWVVNGFFVYLPLVRPSTEFENEVDAGGGITAFVGSTIFQFGSILLMLEAVNENREECLGWAVERAVDGKRGLRVTQDRECCHHHSDKAGLLAKKALRSHAQADGAPARGSDRTWTWLPTKKELREHYIHELGFIACSSQMVGATIFWIAGFTSLPGIKNHLSPGAEDGLYWTPQVVGGAGFIISGFLFALETQKEWYKPALNVLGWHVGAWNWIGGIGFTLCGALGYSTSSKAEYQSALATFWGGWFFLVGSLVQMYEALDKYPVESEKDD